VYAATKDGLASYARSLSVALAPCGIHVLTVFPGPTRTEHARRYSPDNSREEKRMAPEALAEQIFQAVKRRRRALVPGLGNRVFAWMGFCVPKVAEAVMRRVMLRD
jgi:short-subunit dehydrogenase